jgi:hypothetical protein
VLSSLGLAVDDGLVTRFLANEQGFAIVTWIWGFPQSIHDQLCWHTTVLAHNLINHGVESFVGFVISVLVSTVNEPFPLVSGTFRQQYSSWAASSWRGLPNRVVGSILRTVNSQQAQ